MCNSSCSFLYAQKRTKKGQPQIFFGVVIFDVAPRDTTRSFHSLRQYRFDQPIPSRHVKCHPISKKDLVAVNNKTILHAEDNPKPESEGKPAMARTCRLFRGAAQQWPVQQGEKKAEVIIAGAFSLLRFFWRSKEMKDKKRNLKIQ
jgi:hypothetical protein